MRLCLDEHYSKDIAAQLRKREQAVDCVKERTDLVGLGDDELWRRMQAEHRALLTENVGDFVPLVSQSLAAGDTHWGVVFSSPRSMPRGAATIGVFVASLEALMRQFPGDDDFCGRIEWLQP